MFEFLYTVFQATIDAFLTPGIPFSLRLRLLGLQSINLLLYALKCTHKVAFRSPPAYRTIYIPTRNRDRPSRCLVYNASRSPSYPTTNDHVATTLRPLHLTLHGGAFIGGLPEFNHDLALDIVRETRAVVVSASYRLAPRFPFPAAIDDVDDIISWLVTNAENALGADANCLTISGLSAGANLALAACANVDKPERIKGIVTFYASIDLWTPPWKKRKVEGMPKRDPMSWMMPLFDAYAQPSRARGEGREDRRLNPVRMEGERLPKRMLMVVAGIDILWDEQMEFYKRVKGEFEELEERNWEERSIEMMVLEKAFHGSLECKSFSSCSFGFSIV